MRAAPQVLNAYVDALGRGARTDGARIEFWVPEAGALARLEADLPPHGSLGPLFYAFGLISAEDLRSGAGTYATGALHQLHKQGVVVDWKGHTGLSKVAHQLSLADYLQAGNRAHSGRLSCLLDVTQSSLM